MKVIQSLNNITHDYGAELLRARGIEDIDLFLHPTEACLQSFQDLKNYQMGVKVIERTLNDKRPYALIFDSDCDGVCSGAIFYQYIKQLNPQKDIQFFIHSGKQHGFSDMLDKLLDVDWSLIIAPDSASNDGEYIKQFSCPVLVLDHHIKEVNTEIPLNMILINNQTSPNYHNKDLCGGGVVWQFCRALDEFYLVNYAKDYIDLAALAIIGDMMNILNYENQYIIKTGLNNIKNEMFKTLLEKQDYSIGNEITPIKIAFYIVPLINAMIRVGTPDEKNRLYQSFIEPNIYVESHKRGAKGAQEKICIESARECGNAKVRQDKQKKEMAERLEVKIFKQDLLENQILFIRLDEDDNFPAVLNGLCCMQLCAKYHKPTIIARKNEEGYDRGSIRAPSNTELTSFKNYLNNTGLFEYVQGHDLAAGCSIADSNLKKLHEKANIELASIDFNNKYYTVDFTRNALDVDLPSLIIDLDKYTQIWGQGCPEPMIYIKNFHFSKKDIQIIGRNKDTIKIMKNGIAYMQFFAKDLIAELEQIEDNNIKVEVVGKANLNEWMGTITPQIFIEQIEVKPDSILEF